MSDEQVTDLLQAVEQGRQEAESTAQQAVDEVTNETAEAS
jgi:DNA-binding protein H-NS